MAIEERIILVLMVFHAALAFPPQGRLMPDGAPVPEDVVAHQDSAASASEMDEEYEDADDSDMYMEPEDEEEVDKYAEEPEESSTLSSTPKTSQNGSNPSLTQLDATLSIQDSPNLTQSSESTLNLTVPLPTEPQHNSTSPNPNSKDQAAENTKETQHQSSSSLETESQNFFPSFAELFSSHRLPFSEQQRYRPNRFLGYFQRDRSGYQSSSATNKEVQHPLLGSGNFGVIRGGTYYPEDKEADEYSADDSTYNPYYRGRSNYYRNPKPQPIRGGDFFANFRDFADITAPPKSSFSHLSVVYANKNGSEAGRITEPRNIIETLRMLEEEEPRKKLSKGKRKLIKMKQSEEEKIRRSRFAFEPLLALS